MYLTYAEYQTYGGTLTQAAFVPLELKCRKRIDYLTDNRVTEHMETIPEDIKVCMYSLINIESAVGGEKQATQPVVTSFNTDGYSESYGHSLDAKGAEKLIDDTIKTMLWGIYDDEGTPILYRGVRQA